MFAAGLLHKKSQEGTQTTMEATLATQQTPQQREQACSVMLLLAIGQAYGCSCDCRQLERAGVQEPDHMLFRVSSRRCGH